jgi:predicted RND superfamily exporter protein
VKANLVGRLVSTDFRAAMIVASLQDLDPTTRQRLDYFDVARRLEERIRSKYVSDTVDVKIIGFAKLIGDIADGAKSVFEFFAVAFVLTVLMLYIYCRSWILTAITVSSSLCSLIWQFGFLHLMGYGLDPLAVLVPFLVFAIGVSHGVQQVNMAGAEIANGKTKEQAARDTFTLLLIPGVVALSTCLAGFATLYIIPIGMIRELAITASIGVALKIISNLIMLPLLVSYVAPTAEYAKRVQAAMATRERFWPYLARIAYPRNAFLLIGFCFLLGVGGIMISRGYVTGQGLQIGDVHAGAAELRPESRYNRDITYITEHFNLGLNILTVIVEVPEGACVNYPVMGMLDRFQWKMANVQGVQSSVGLPIMAKQLAVMWREGNLKWHALPRNSDVIAQSVNQIQPDSGMLNAKCTVLPLNVYTTDTKAETVKRVVDAVKEFRSEPINQIPGVSIRLATGNVGITAATNEVVKSAEIPMLLYVYGVVMTLVLLTYREWRGSLCCVLPLILSTIIGNMFLTLAGIGLKISTLPVLAIAVGIGVDYGIYEYNRIQRYMAAGRNAYDAYLQALNDVGSATMFTGFTLAVGVSTWSFSALKFQADMGLLLTFMFMINMIGAVTLLPALIAALEVIAPRKTRKLAPEPEPIHGH